jgi:16S rRNA (cytidine1402-2'-O)-methyltransferase
MGTLFLVGTPIGNLEDVTLRALRVLREVQVIAAEDTRTTRKLLSHYEIHTPLTSFHDFSGPGKVRRLVERLESEDVALVSEAGMPGLSDPGYPLVEAALAAGRSVTTVPGPSALVSALVLSGLPTHACHYLGFLPRKSGARRRLLERVAAEPDTLVMYESPHRLVAALRDVQAVLGPRRVAVARELTKRFEEIARGTAEEALAHFERTPPRGEFTVVVAGAEANDATERDAAASGAAANDATGSEDERGPGGSRGPEASAEGGPRRSRGAVARGAARRERGATEQERGSPRREHGPARPERGAAEQERGVGRRERGAARRGRGSGTGVLE